MMVACLVVVEVGTFLNCETVMAVKLKVARMNRVTFAIKSKTVVIMLGNSYIFVNTISSRIGRSVVDSKIFNRNGTVSKR